MFFPAEIRFCRLLLGVISRSDLRSQLLVVVARGILGAPAFAKLPGPLAEPLLTEGARLMAKLLLTRGALAEEWLT